MGFTYGWARDYALELIDQYSIAGAQVAETYNNQADYLQKIPRLVDDAQTIAATTVHPIREIVPLLSLPHRIVGRSEVYTLPENCWQMSGSGLLRFDRRGVPERSHRFRYVGRDQIAMPPLMDVDGEWQLEYFRYPALVGQTPGDDTPLDNIVPVQMAIPFYVAAFLVMLDNSYAYATLFNQWESKLNAGVERVKTEWDRVHDAYGGEEDDPW